MSEGVVIVGGGQAGFQVAASLRAGGYGGRVRLIGAEAHPPYQRPPLSKALLLGKMERERLLFRQPAFYEAQTIELLLGETVTAVDRAARSVTIGWRGDATATRRWCSAPARGCGHCRYPAPSSRASSTCEPSTNSEELARRIAAAQRVVVIGGGFIGLEVAAAARMLGKPVTVLEAAERLMGRVVAPVISTFYADLHRSRGVELVLDARIARLEGDGGRVRAVAMTDGTRHAADLVVIGIGVLPNVELAIVGRPRVRERHRRRCARPHQRSRDLRRRRVHPAPQPVRRRLGAAGIGAERGRPGQGRGGRDPRPARRRTTRCPGSGATSTRSSCRWSASRPGTTSWCCAAIRPAGSSRSATSRTAGCRRSIRSTGRATTWPGASCWRPARR